MGKANKQAEAVNHIQELLTKRGLDIRSRKLTLEDDQHWTIFQHNQRQIGIDSASGVWVRESIRHEWRCSAPRGAKREWMGNPIACTGR
jgi:hypothetical protein